MKNVLLLGATGKTGREVLNYALSKGFHVIALVRDPGKVDMKSDRFTLVKGTPLNINDLRSIAGYEAVISTLGHSLLFSEQGLTDYSPPEMMTRSIKNVINTMKEKGIRRIIVQTGAGAGDSFEKIPLTTQKAIRETKLSIVYADHNGQESSLMKSDLDWTVVRPVTMSDAEEDEILIKQDSISESSSIGRKSVAKFLVGCLETDEFIKKAVVISGN